MMIHDPVSQRSDFFCFWRFKKKKKTTSISISISCLRRSCANESAASTVGDPNSGSAAGIPRLGRRSDDMAMRCQRSQRCVTWKKKTCPVRWKIVGIQIRSNHFNWGLSLWRNFWYMFTWNTSWYLICHESWCLKMFDLNWTEAQAVPSPRPGARTLPRSGRTHGRKSLGANPTHPTWKVVDWTKLSFNVHKTHRKNGKMI